MQKNAKKRVWAFVVYPESAPSDWNEQLQLKGLQCAVSPLHDKDVNPTGEPKKPHYHIIAVWSGPTTYNSVKNLTDSLNAPIPQPLEHIRGYYRYLTHKDNPEKHQYDEADIQHLNGFNLADFCELTANEVNEIKRSLRALIREMDMLEYSCLMEYLDDQNMAIEADVAANHTMFFTGYLRSRRHRAQHHTGIADRMRTDPQTGEVVADEQ